MSLAWIAKAALAAALIVGAAGISLAQTTNWQNHKINPAGFWFTANEISFAEKVAEATEGQLQINVFPASSAGFSGDQILDAISENLLQMGEAYGGHVAGQERILEMTDLPHFVPADYEFRVELWDTLLPLYKDYLESRYDVVILDFMQFNPRRLYTKRPVESLEDLRGMKIRAIGPADAAFIRAIGAEPTATEWSELYTALQQGMVDGHMAADGAQLAMKFHEVTDYIYDTANAGPTLFVFVNRSALEELPDDVRETFLELYEELRQTNRSSYLTEDDAAREALVRAGMTVHPVSSSDEARMLELAEPIIEDWASRLDAEARKIYDVAREMIDAYHAGN